MLEYYSDEDWKQFLSHAEHRTFSAAETLVEAGDRTRLMFVVVEGKLDVVIDEEGGNKRIDTIEAPSVFGEQTFLDGQPRTASIAARTDGACYCLHMDGLLSLSEENPALAAAFLYDLARVLSLRFRAWQ